MLARNRPPIPLVMLSQEYDDDPWAAFEGPETPFQSWLAVRQDLWGLGCFEPNQPELIHECALALEMTPAQIVGAVGRDVGGLGDFAAKAGIYIEIHERHAALLAHHDAKFAGTHLRLSAWNPEAPGFRSNRYHALLAANALSSVDDLSTTAGALCDSLKPGGLLFVSDIWAADDSVAALLPQGSDKLCRDAIYDPLPSAMAALTGAGLQQRTQVDVSAVLRETIRLGLLRAQGIASKFNGIPVVVRKQRMLAFADELKRISLSHLALGDGMLKSTYSIFRKPRF